MLRIATYIAIFPAKFLKRPRVVFILKRHCRRELRGRSDLADALGGCVSGILCVHHFDSYGETLMKKDQSRSKLQSVKRRVAYSLAAGAATGAVGVGASDAHATIVWSGPYPITVNQYGYANLDLDEYGASPDLELKNYVFGGGNYMGAEVKFFPGQLVLSNSTFPFYVSALSVGDLIDSTTVGPTFYGSLAYGAVNPNSEFNNTDAYIGLSFPSGPNLFYGWVRVAIDQPAGSFQVLEWAYNNVSGQGIRAGQIPEPTTLGMLAAGSAGLLAMRRRRQAA